MAAAQGPAPLADYPADPSLNYIGGSTLVRAAKQITSSDGSITIDQTTPGTIDLTTGAAAAASASAAHDSQVAAAASATAAAASATTAAAAAKASTDTFQGHLKTIVAAAADFAAFKTAIGTMATE